MRLTSRPVSAALGAMAVGVLVARAARKIIVNTGKRAVGLMAAPSSTKELDEAIDAGLDLAVRIKQSLAEGSPGGKQITLNEMLESVSDGQVRASIEKLIEAVDSIVKGGKVDVFSLLPTAMDAILEFMGVLRDALKDGRVTPDEILHSVTTGNLRPELERAIEGIDKVPDELKGMDMWKMIGLVQRVMAKLPALLS